MVARVTEGVWHPLPGARPAVVDPGVVYVVPTRTPGENEALGQLPRYTDQVRYLPKTARAAGAPVEFSLPEGQRRYIQEFSAGPDSWSLALVLFQISSDWLIFTISQFIALRGDTEGWSPEEAGALPLKVWFEETETSRSFEVEGSGDEVLEAIRLLQGKEPERDPDE